MRLRSDEELARVLIASGTRVVQKDGVHFRTRIYACPALHGLRGETVDIAFMPHDPRQIVLYRRGEPLGVAVPQDLLTDDERQAILQRRAEDARELRRRRTRARQRARVRIASITAGQAIEETTIIDRQEAARESSSPADAALRRLARRHLLELDEPE